MKRLTTKIKNIYTQIIEYKLIIYTLLIDLIYITQIIEYKLITYTLLIDLIYIYIMHY